MVERLGEMRKREERGLRKGVERRDRERDKKTGPERPPFIRISRSDRVM